MQSTMLPYLWDGKKFIKIHYEEFDQGCRAWVKVGPFKKEEQYGMDKLVIDRLVKRLMKQYGWCMVKAVPLYTYEH